MLNTRAIKETVRRYNLAISPRRLGQNFLVDPRILERIVHVVDPTAQDRVLEIGAGLGALTEGLLATGTFVIAVERDARFVQVLSDRFKEHPHLEIVRSDILNLALDRFALHQPKSLLVAGNIPFSLTSPILEYLLKQRAWVKRAVLTVQKEVAQRIVASPGTKAYSSLSVLVAVAFRPSISFTIPPNVFYPQPKVTSAVLRLDPLEKPVVPPEEEEGILKLVRLLFTYRRKTLLNSLCQAWLEISREEMIARLKEGGFDPIRRPETFSLQEFLTLHRRLFPPKVP